MTLRLVFMGTPDFAVPTLRALIEAGHEIAAVYTQPPRKAGRRGLALTPSPVQAEAERLGIEVRTPTTLRNADEQDRFRALDTDVGVVVAYGLLLPQPILDAPRHFCLNGHGSLLPRWRGAAPVQRAIEAGDRETGVMVMRMEAGLDTGPVALTAETPIGGTQTASELHDVLAVSCAALMTQALGALEAGTLSFTDQATLGARTGREPTYAAKIDKSEAELDFSAGAEAVAEKINAFSPFPGAWTMLSFGGGGGGERERVKFLRAAARADGGGGEPGTILDGEGFAIACGTGAVEILELQRSGGRPMAAGDLLRGSPPDRGARVGRP